MTFCIPLYIFYQQLYSNKFNNLCRYLKWVHYVFDGVIAEHPLVVLHQYFHLVSGERKAEVSALRVIGENTFSLLVEKETKSANRA